MNRRQCELDDCFKCKTDLRERESKGDDSRGIDAKKRRERKNKNSLKLFALAFTFAFALVCFDYDKIA